VPAHLKRLLKPEDLVCPAAVLMNDCDSFCRIEDGLIEGRVNPDSIAAYCAGDHLSCPTWQADKEALWEQRDLLRDGIPQDEEE